MAYKQCPQCNKQSGVRTLSCECGHKFAESRKKVVDESVASIKGGVRKSRNAPVANFKELKAGERIKVAGGGSYWMNKDGQRIYIGYRGRFTVKAVDQNGIYAYGNKKEGEQSMCYIWMGRNLLSKAGVHRRAHKVLRA